MDKVFSLQKDTLKALPPELRDLIDVHITARLLAFHQALLERGQIQAPPSTPGQATIIVDCTADSDRS